MIYNLSYNLDETKVVSQIQSHKKGYNWNASNSLRKIPFDGPINFDIEFPTFYLEKHSSYTDTIDNVYKKRFLTISQKSIELFKKFDIDEHSLHTIQIQKAAIIKDYYILHCSHERTHECIDWDKSFFDIYNRKTDKLIQKQKFNSYDDYLTSSRNVTSYTKVHKLKQNSNWEKDLFRARLPLEGEYFCSEKLKNAIEEYSLSGFQFDKVNIEY